MDHAIKTWFSWQGEEDCSAEIRRKVFNVNVAILIALISITLYGFVYALMENEVLTRCALSHLPFYAVFSFVSWLIRRGYIVVGRWLFGVSVTLLLYTVILIGQGTYLGAHYGFALLALFSVMFFPIAERAAQLTFFLLNAVSFAWLQYYGLAPDPELLELDEEIVVAFNMSIVLTSIVILQVILWLSERATRIVEEELEKASLTDILTGVANRRCFDEIFDWEWNRSLRTAQPLTLVFIDIDRFSNFNDYYGHHAGDERLRTFADTLKTGVLRTSDFFARYDGDKFILLLPQTDSAEALDFAERIRQAVQLAGIPHKTSEQGSLSVSIGIASAEPGDDPEEKQRLLALAGKALERAKQRGRNRVEAG